MMISTQKTTPDTPNLVMNCTDIVMCSNVKYLGVVLDDKLRFPDHVQSKVSTRSEWILSRILLIQFQALL